MGRRNPKKDSQKSRDRRSAGGIFGTFEWLITAFSFTLVFIVFQMQAYTIPTGSMADTLKGAHFRLRCRQCGYRYDYDFLGRYYKDYKIAANSTPAVNVPIRPSEPRCPSCGYYLQIARKTSVGGYSVWSGETRQVTKGDRIFVLKCIYQFTEPKRWDVVVFKNPLNPRENYIKRMIATPGETLEIIDGDVYIDGQIARKPPKVQEELWMCVYDNDYQPVMPETRRFNGHIWSQPFVNMRGSEWNLDGQNQTQFALDDPTGKTHTIIYDTKIGNDFKATYAYDDSRFHPAMPICSDLMVRFHVGADATGIIGAGLSKYGTLYEGRVDLSGWMVIEEIAGRRRRELARLQINPVSIDEPVLFKFANVDRQLILEFADESLKFDFGQAPDDIGQRQTGIMPKATIFGAGKLTLSNVGIFRDIYYITSTKSGHMKALRAGEGDPFELGPDEFFVLGDNSPASKDSRLWEKPGKGNNGRQYRPGIVPRDYLVGKAFFVYWPGAMKPFAKGPRAVPYLGGMKAIYGGQY
ncbi:MAG: signal peptidase I [Planctomycetota bacterium]